jgi:hypothetical protein
LLLQNVRCVVNTAWRSHLAQAAALLLLLQVGCTKSHSPKAGDEATGHVSAADCDRLAPDNPYDSASEQYSGFKWGIGHPPGSCGGHSIGFDQGCREHERQANAYEACLPKE